MEQEPWFIIRLGRKVYDKNGVEKSFFVIILIEINTRAGKTKMNQNYILSRNTHTEFLVSGKYFLPNLSIMAWRLSFFNL